MKYAWKEEPEGSGNSKYVRLSSTANEGEKQDHFDYTVDGKWGMRDDHYSVLNGVLTPITQEEADAIALTGVKLEKQNDIITYGSAQDSKPFEYPTNSKIFWKVTDAVMETIVERDGDTSENIEWDNVDGTHSQVFTLSEFKTFYKFGYKIAKDNYANVKFHISEMKKKTDVQSVVNYDYSAGWS